MVASAHLKKGATGDAHIDVWGLFLNFYFDLASVAANAFFRGSVTDIAKDFSRDFFIIWMGFAGDFASDEDEFGGCENLTGNV